ncbi:MAG: cysteine--tRNA ligase, partial [Oscillospiraceae bacterium]|nr:cysteine--tRNA ligase [Candidatus Equicaccousia limihippi]
NTTVKELAEKYIKEFKVDSDGLNVMPADVHPKATENVDAIIDLVSTLIEKEYAYIASNGDVYFRTLKDKDYGKLCHQPMDELMSGARIEVNDIKESPVDFALWKAAKEGEPYWESPFSKGRPGWHIECSAMIKRYLGDTIDIHCGGEDLIFPHHENEIAQSECANGCEFARFFMHNGYINIDNRKMSKSLGNFFTVREVANVYGYEPIRFIMVASHYRSPINYSKEVIESAKAALERLYTCKNNILFAIDNAKDLPAADLSFIDTATADFEKAMDDDLNTADAMGVLFTLVKNINGLLAQGANRADLEKCLDVFMRLCDIFGFLYEKGEENIDGEIEDLIAQRTDARKNKDFAKADEIRDKLKAMGIELEDTKDGVKWRKI